MTSFPLKWTAANVCQNMPMNTLLSCFPQLFKYGSESSTGAKVKGHESCLWSESSRGAKVPWNESSCTSRSKGANVPRNESSVCGLFASGNESAEEWKGLDSNVCRISFQSIENFKVYTSFTEMALVTVICRSLGVASYLWWITVVITIDSMLPARLGECWNLENRENAGGWRVTDA